VICPGAFAVRHVRLAGRLELEAELVFACGHNGVGFDAEEFASDVVVHVSQLVVLDKEGIPARGGALAEQDPIGPLFGDFDISCDRPLRPPSRRAKATRAGVPPAPRQSPTVSPPIRPALREDHSYSCLARSDSLQTARLLRPASANEASRFSPAEAPPPPPDAPASGACR
jgi:hypothetical protein